MKFEKFTNSSVTRYCFGLWKDQLWYGVGWTDTVFWRNSGYHGKAYFLISYRHAPVSFNLLHNFGWWRDKPTWVPHLYFTGSTVDPYHSWHFRLGRAFVGGYTPRWAIRLHKWFRLKRWEWQARSDGEGLCPKCQKGVIMAYAGYPGETIYQCSNKKCQHVEGYDFDINAVI